MIHVVVDNSTCSITGLSIEQHKTLRDILSYRIDKQAAYFSGQYSSSKRYLLDKRGNFPTGLLYLVMGYTRAEKLDLVYTDRRLYKGRQGLFKLSLPHNPYPEQLEASTAAVERARGIIVAVTGSGKSLIAALIIEKLDVRTLVVVPSLELKRQLIETLSGAFGTSFVGSLEDGRGIAVENVDALDPDQVIDNYDCVIIDEFHHSGAASYRKLNRKAWSKVFFKFGLTATPFRANDNERLLLESVLSEVIYKLDYQKAVDKGYILPLDAYADVLPKTKTTAVTYAQAYNELIVNRKDRNDAIVDYMKTAIYLGIPTLVLVKQIAHGELLCDLMIREGIGVHFANGQDAASTEHIAKFSRGELSVLIATSIVGEGVDTRAATVVILAGGTGKSKVQIMQNCGRVLRKFGDTKDCGQVITFKEPSHKWFLQHHRFFVKLMKEEYGIEVKEK